MSSTSSDETQSFLSAPIAGRFPPAISRVGTTASAISSDLTCGAACRRAGQRKQPVDLQKTMSQMRPKSCCWSFHRTTPLPKKGLQRWTSCIQRPLIGSLTPVVKKRI